MSEYFRPWKLLTLALGFVVLIIGAYTENAPDWDVPVSIIMALVAYLTAPTAVRSLERFAVQLVRQRAFAWTPLLVGLFLVWFGADGCYYLYWVNVNPWALEQMRAANAPASSLLYLLCGFLWKPRCSVREMFAGLRNLWPDRT